MEFLEYFEKWTSLSLKEKIPILVSTLTGLRVSLRATLEIVDMLIEKKTGYIFSIDTGYIEGTVLKRHSRISICICFNTARI